MKPYAAVLIAWAQGKDVQCGRYAPAIIWNDYTGSLPPDTSDGRLWRIKPEPKPDVVQEWHVKQDFNYMRASLPYQHNLRLTFDGETGQLKSAEVLNAISGETGKVTAEVRE